MLGAAAASRLLRELSDQELAAPADASFPTIEGYSLQARIGAGAGGTVYRAFRADGGSDRPLAIKVLASRFSSLGIGGLELGRGSSRPGRRAWRELELLSDLRIPCLPRVLDYGVWAGRLYIVTEFIDGQRLDEFAEEGDLDRRGRVALLAKVADAVQSLHEHGVIHRDLKPSNVLIDAAGNPIIIDLGIATLLAADVMETLTADGAPIGTPAYMAPEQARGERARISTRTDVYALGATATMLLTSHTPHDLSDVSLAEAVHRVAHNPPRPPSDLDPSLPRPLAAVLAKACDPIPERRYETAAAFADDLRRWLKGEPVEASPPGVWMRAARWIGRHPVVTTAAACTAVGGAIIGFTFLSVHWLAREPVGYRIRVTIDPLKREDLPQRGELQVVARNGASLHHWPILHPDDSVNFLEFRERPEEFGGGRVAITGMKDPVYGVYLAAWDPKDFSRPLWSTQNPSRPLEIPPRTEDGWRQVTPGELRLTSATIADIFTGPDHPGPEIVATFCGHHHPASIRIFNLAGEVLFEAWHPGSCGHPYWVPETGQVVFSAHFGERTWKQAGYPAETPEQLWPRTLFAIEPSPGQFGGWIVGPKADGVVQPVWYKFFAPWPLAAQVGFYGLGTPRDTARSGDCVRVDLGFSPEVRFEWTLDRRGEIVHVSDSDHYDLRFNPDRPQVKLTSDQLLKLVDELPEAEPDLPVEP